MRKQRVSKKQKRIRPAAAKTKPTAASSNAKILKKALHLLMGSDHFRDRAAAERLRQFPNVPRKRQKPFPRDVEIGFVGHYKKREFAIQDDDSFVAEYVANSEKAYYFRNDKRGNREPRKEVSGLVETNAALSTGLSMVLAGLVEKGETGLVKNIMLLAAKAGMMTLEKRSRYKPAFLALHPDWEGTMSVHFGLWPVDPVKHVLIGISATGKVGKKGLRTLGDSFTSVLRHDRALIHGGKNGLPAGMLKRPEENLKLRDPDDWAVAEEMDRVVMEELGKLPEGPELLKQAEGYQLEAAEDWLKRYNGSKTGVDRKHAEMEQAKATIAALEATVKEGAGMLSELQSVLKMILALPGIEELIKSAEDLWESVVALAKSVGLFLNAPEPALVEVGTVEPAVAEPVVAEPVVAESIDDMEATVVDSAVVESAVMEPAVMKPVVVEPVVVEPVAVEPVAEELVIAEPAAEEPITEKPLIEESVVEESVTDDSVAMGSVSNEPDTEKTGTENPVTNEPVAAKFAAEPVAAPVDAPVATPVAAPVAEEFVTEKPETDDPVATKLAVEDAAVNTTLAEAEIAEEVPARTPVSKDSISPPEPSVLNPASDEKAPQAVDPTKPKPWRPRKIIWENDKKGPTKGD